uniref:Vacuolar protein sorting-associated protein VTA1 n=1 Tax=Rhabditophanes sp. KR3021 TaxID=114890 RepID=A0AC35UH48_9BILA
MSAIVPQALKPIGPIIKLSKEYVQRDPTVYYWCIMYSVQQGIRCPKSNDGDKFLGIMLSTLERMKIDFASVDTIIHQVAGQSHMEEVTYKIFEYANEQDKIGNTDRNTVKSFYTAGLLFDVMSQFGELDEAMASARKYAKWRATHINNCIKNGIPVEAPPNNDGLTNNEMDEFERELLSFDNKPSAPPASTFSQPPFVPTRQEPQNLQMGQQSFGNNSSPSISSGSYNKDSDLLDYSEVKKLIKFAMSALDYEDKQTAISNLSKALNILQK